LSDDFKILVVSVQFIDRKTNDRPANVLAEVALSMSEVCRRVTTVPANFNWTIPEG
jgi:hypothetical protein